MLLFTQIGWPSIGVQNAVLAENSLTQAKTEVSVPAVAILPKQEQTVSSKEEKVAPVLTVEQTIKKTFASAPVLIGIARCESRYRQYESNGDILRGKVNKSDIGVMQINEKFHASRARSLGLDLYTLKGNLAYALRLYKEQGTTPWASSEGCWGSAVATAT